MGEEREIEFWKGEICHIACAAPEAHDTWTSAEKLLDGSSTTRWQPRNWGRGIDEADGNKDCKLF